MKEIEVFSAGCPLCDDVLALIKQHALSGSEITIHDMHKADSVKRANMLNINRVPSVAIDGEVIGCCQDSGVDLEVVKSHLTQ